MINIIIKKNFTIILEINNFVRKAIIKLFILLFLSALISKDSLADEKFLRFKKSLDEISINMSAINGVTAKCFTLEITNTINTNKFWQKQFNDNLKFMKDPTYLVGFFEEYIIKYHPNKYDPLDYDPKEGKFTKKIYRTYNKLVKENDCIGSSNSNAYITIKENQDRTKAFAALMFGNFVGIDKGKANLYLSYFKKDEPEVFNFIMDGHQLTEKFTK